jgi:methionyl aminopeptidase
MSAARFGRRHAIEIKTPEQLDLMRAAGLVVAGALDAVVAALRPGVTTGDLDLVARDYLGDHGAASSFLGYHGFPAVICTSVNEQIVHGIPGDQVIEEGDLVSIDCGAIVQGWHGDAARTVAVGPVSQAEADLLRVTEDALWQGLAAARVGGRLSDIGHAVESWIRPRGEYGIVEEYVGHGIGTRMHMEPSVPNYGSPGHGPRLVAGMAVAVEPMVNLGGRHTVETDDGWTVVTADGARSAHFEHTVAITPAGPWVLTAADGGRSRFAAMGVPTPAAASAP